MTHHKPIYGPHDPPRDLPAKHGQPFINRQTGRVWFMTGNGWEPASVVSVNVRKAQKIAWNAAARRAQLALEQWIVETLDGAAAETAPSKYADDLKRHIGREKF